MNSGYTEARLSATLFENRGGSFSRLARRMATLVSSPKCFISSLLKSKVWPSMETSAIDDLILLISTGSVKFTATKVPPLKSILSLGPPFMIIDVVPIMMRIADRHPARNVLLIKSICVSFIILMIKYLISLKFY